MFSGPLPHNHDSSASVHVQNLPANEMTSGPLIRGFAQMHIKITSRRHCRQEIVQTSSCPLGLAKTISGQLTQRLAQPNMKPNKIINEKALASALTPAVRTSSPTSSGHSAILLEEPLGLQRTLAHRFGLEHAGTFVCTLCSRPPAGQCYLSTLLPVVPPGPG